MLKHDHSHSCNGYNMPSRAAGGRRNATTHNGGEPFAPGKSHISFYSHRECMEETHEYANKLGKPEKNTKIHECFSRKNIAHALIIDTNFYMERTALTVAGFTQPLTAQGLTELPSSIEKSLTQLFLWLFPSPSYSKLESPHSIDEGFVIFLGELCSALYRSEHIFTL